MGIGCCGGQRPEETEEAGFGNQTEVVEKDDETIERVSEPAPEEKPERFGYDIKPLKKYDTTLEDVGQQKAKAVFDGLTRDLSQDDIDSTAEAAAKNAMSRDRLKVVLDGTQEARLTCAQLNELLGMCSLDSHKKQIIFERYPFLVDKDTFTEEVLNKFTLSHALRSMLMKELSKTLEELEVGAAALKAAEDAARAAVEAEKVAAEKAAAEAAEAAQAAADKEAAEKEAAEKATADEKEETAPLKGNSSDLMAANSAASLPAKEASAASVQSEAEPSKQASAASVQSEAEPSKQASATSVQSEEVENNAASMNDAAAELAAEEAREAEKAAAEAEKAKAAEDAAAAPSEAAKTCSKGCGRPAFGKFPTCCTRCKGADGPHTHDCEGKASAANPEVI